MLLGTTECYLKETLTESERERGRGEKERQRQRETEAATVTHTHTHTHTDSESSERKREGERGGWVRVYMQTKTYLEMKETYMPREESRHADLRMKVDNL